MKTRFNTYDVVCQVAGLQKLVGMRVNQVYDIDNRTYLIRFQRNEEKCVLLLESGIRFHTTSFEWPKNVAPSGFTMKLRKHLKNKRLEKLTQLGVDRIVDLQFGTNDAAYHVILEMYDRGNLVLTDNEYTILNILRFHVDGDVVKFAVKEKYPLHFARPDNGPPSSDKVRETLLQSKGGESLRTVVNPILDFGPSLIDHVLHKFGLFGCKIKAREGGENVAEEGKKKKKNRKKDESTVTRDFDMEKDFVSLISAINEAENLLRQGMREPSKGFIIQKKEPKPVVAPGEDEYYYSNIEYQPFLYQQYKDEPFKPFQEFDLAVDEFYSTLEGQKIDLKAFQTEKEALRKLTNVKEDHAKRLEELNRAQEEDMKKAELITRNQNLVDSAILAINSALANQMSWTDIHELVKAAQANKDPVASCIKQLKLEINHIALSLADPYQNQGSSDEDEDEREPDEQKLEPMVVDIDLGLSAFANARKYYDMKRFAAKKEQKTIESSEKALKSAERRTQTALKEIRKQTKISKARKTYWFEKFYWFISSENYLVIGGRDQQQNELIVKRYMKPTDYYVHAEIQGASSVIIKNPSGLEVPPKTLLEAGTMAISYSVAWDAKVVTSAYWVKGDQVTKTAPTGEYLQTGSFMIRGKRNFLPPCHLVLGLSFLFKLEDGSVERHLNERRVRNFDDETSSMSTVTTENEKLADVQEETEIELKDDSADEQERVEEISKAIEEVQVQENVAKDSEEEEEDVQEKTDDEDEAGPSFPDTEIKIKHDFDRQESTLLEEIVNEEYTTGATDEDQTLIISSQPTRIKQQASKKMKQATRQQNKEKKGQPKPSQVSGNEGKPGQFKRGQKSKLKKIKEKYKDQDDDERELRMQILQSAGNRRQQQKEKDNNEEEASKKNPRKFVERKKPQDDDILDDTPAAAEVDMLDTLTGHPVEEDELLFAIPVVAPYQTLQSYKYKVKLTPGSGKRGKAAKTALEIFIRDKSCTAHEKDLLKAVKDEFLARNIPGKVKLSAPQMHKVKK